MQSLLQIRWLMNLKLGMIVTISAWRFISFYVRNRWCSQTAAILLQEIVTSFVNIRIMKRMMGNKLYISHSNKEQFSGDFEHTRAYLDITCALMIIAYHIIVIQFHRGKTDPLFSGPVSFFKNASSDFSFRSVPKHTASIRFLSMSPICFLCFLWQCNKL